MRFRVFFRCVKVETLLPAHLHFTYIQCNMPSLKVDKDDSSRNTFQHFYFELINRSQLKLLSISSNNVKTVAGENRNSAKHTRALLKSLVTVMFFSFAIYVACDGLWYILWVNTTNTYNMYQLYYGYLIANIINQLTISSLPGVSK